MALTIEEKLDLIFNEVKDHYGHHPIAENWERICRLVTDGDGVTTGNPDYKRDPFLSGLLQGLTDEGFVYRRLNFPAVADLTYFATVKGLMFEGFVNQKARLERERQALNLIHQEQRSQAAEQVQLSRRLTKMNNQMVALTVIIAIGAAIVAWADLIEIWEYYWTYDYFRLF